MMSVIGEVVCDLLNHVPHPLFPPVLKNLSGALLTCKSCAREPSSALSPWTKVLLDLPI